jgi:tetratricopeptide (TPR) repeat protein
VFAPDALPDLAPVVQLVERAVAEEPDNYSVLNTLGSVLYRANRPTEAVQRLDQAVKIQGKGGSAWDLLFLAMAHQRLGHTEEARQLLDKVLPRLDQVLGGTLRDLDFAAIRSWEDRLELQLFRREAEALVKGKVADPKK